MYRVVYSRYHSRGIIIPVPEQHPKSRKVFIHMYNGRAICGLHSYLLYSTFEQAEECLRQAIRYHDEHSKRMYDFGKLNADTYRKKEAFSKHGDSKLVERFLRREP